MDEIQVSIFIKIIGFLLDLIIIIFNVASLQKVMPSKITYSSKGAQTCRKDFQEETDDENEHFQRFRYQYRTQNKNFRHKSPPRNYKVDQKLFDYRPVKQPQRNKKRRNHESGSYEYYYRYF